MKKVHIFAIALSRTEFEKAIVQKAKTERFVVRLRGNELTLKRDWYGIGRLSLYVFTSFFATMEDKDGVIEVKGTFRNSPMCYVFSAAVCCLLLSITLFSMLKYKQHEWTDFLFFAFSGISITFLGGYIIRVYERLAGMFKIKTYDKVPHNSDNAVLDFMWDIERMKPAG
jgi:hypothetical protein